MLPMANMAREQGESGRAKAVGADEDRDGIGNEIVMPHLYYI
jgi:hypothetical protein